jgi:hypothetical protein
MRHTLRTIILAALFSALVAGCSQYDKQLLGEPEPKQPDNPTYSQQPQTQNIPADSDSMGVGMFNDLDYYGQWYQRDPYGWVFRPSVVMDWQPFTHGHWIWTQYGWMWVDYDPWGWATSHYGYWYNDFTLGWVWIPDYTWSPVACDWIQYGDYVGWAPQAPPGAAFKDPWDDQKPWVFVPVRKFKETNVAQDRVAPKFKSEDNGDISRAKPALIDVENRGAGMFPEVDVTLDRRVVHDREFARVKYPPDQESIISEHTTMSAKSGGVYGSPVQLNPGSPYTGPGDPVPMPPSAGPVQQGPPAPAHGKSKGSHSQPQPKKETKYKGQKQQPKKEPPKTKDDSKTTDKDDSKDKGGG